MKKVISLFLSVLMVLSLFSCLGVTTFAYDDEAVLEEISFEPIDEIEICQYTYGEWFTYYDYDEEKVVNEFDYDLFYLFWEEGNVITLWYSDGTAVEYTCDEELWYYDEYGNVLDEEYLYFYVDDLVLGTNSIMVEYDGITCDVPVTVVESPVKSAQFVLEEPFTLMQNVDGDLDWVWDGPYAGESVFCYNEDGIFTEGTKFVVEFKDGTEKIFEYYEEYDEAEDYYYGVFCDEFGEYLDWDFLSLIDDQDFDPWFETGNYSFKFYYMGFPFDVGVEIVENDVAAVEYTPAMDYCLRVNFDGEPVYCECDECVENGGEFFYYDLFNSGFPCENDKVTISYKDGTVTDYFYSVEEDWFYDEDGNELPYEVSLLEYQEDEHWEIGYNSIYFWYAGHMASIPFEVVDNPVVDLTISPGVVTVYEYTHGYYDYEDGETFYYYDPIYNDNAELRFEFADGTEEIYSYDSYVGGFFSETTGGFLYADIETDGLASQYDEPWGVGQYDIDVCVLGCEATVTLNIIANPIESIEFTPAEVITFQAYEDGWWDWYIDDDDYGEFFFYDTEDLTPYSEGNKLVVNYTRGTSDTFVYDEEIGNFVNSRGQQLTTTYNVNYWDTQYSVGPWSEESAYNTMLVEFMGRYDYVWVNIENGLPGTPTMTGVYNGVGKILVEWEYLPGAAEYRIYRRGAGQTYWTYLGTTDENYFVDTSGVTHAAYYRYTVRSVNSHGFGSFDTNGLVIRYLAPVQNVKATNVVNGIQISWDDYNYPSNAYCQVFRLAAGESEWEYLGQVRADVYAVIDRNIVNGKYYRYAVLACWGNYMSDIDLNESALIKHVSTPKLTGISNATNGIYIKWNAVSGATGYRVYRRGAGQSTWTYLGTTKNLYFTDTAVKNSSGNYYRYTVRAVSYNTFSGFDTNGLYIKRLANPTLTSAKSSSSGITVKWNAVTGSQGYYVYRKTGNSSWTYLGYVTGTSYLDKSASKGVTYTYTVRARSGNTTSSYNSGISCKDLY